MFISPAYAQAGGGFGGMESLLPLVLIFVVFYFLLIRPQQKKQKAHRAMLGELRRGDRVVTAGGVIGLITRVNSDSEITVQIAEGVRVKVVRSMVSDVMAKTESRDSRDRDSRDRDSGDNDNDNDDDDEEDDTSDKKK